MTTSGGGNENTPAGQNSAQNRRDSIGSRGGKRTATEGIQYNENVVAPALRASKCKAVEVCASTLSTLVLQSYHEFGRKRHGSI